MDDEITTRLDALTARLAALEARYAEEDPLGTLGHVQELLEAANERRRREIDDLRTALGDGIADLRYEIDRVRSDSEAARRRW
jgi:hypothetical protein